MASFDPNLWYNILYANSNEGKVLGRSSNEAELISAVQLYNINTKDVHQQWQIIPSPANDGTVLIRSSLSDPSRYLRAYCELPWTLAKCANETLAGLTISNVPDQAPAELRWRLKPDPSNTSFTIQNVGNTTNLSLGAQDDLIHMLNTSTLWSFSPVANIDDQRFSSLLTATTTFPTITATSSTVGASVTSSGPRSTITSTNITPQSSPSTTSSSNGTSDGLDGPKLGVIIAASAIGGVLILISAVFLVRCCLRRKEQALVERKLAPLEEDDQPASFMGRTAERLGLQRRHQHQSRYPWNVDPYQRPQTRGRPRSSSKEVVRDGSIHNLQSHSYFLSQTTTTTDSSSSSSAGNHRTADPGSSSDSRRSSTHHDGTSMSITIGMAQPRGTTIPGRPVAPYTHTHTHAHARSYSAAELMATPLSRRSPAPISKANSVASNRPDISIDTTNTNTNTTISPVTHRSIVSPIEQRSRINARGLSQPQSQQEESPVSPAALDSATSSSSLGSRSGSGSGSGYPYETRLNHSRSI